MRRGADPDKIGALGPCRHHRRRRQVTELDLAGEQRLDCGGAAAYVDQTRVESVLFEDVLFLGQPKRADTCR